MRRALAAFAASALLAGGLGPAAVAQDLLTGREILDVVAGTWEVDPNEAPDEERGGIRCGDEPEVIAIRLTPDGLVYESRRGHGEDAQVRRSTIRLLSNAIWIVYDDEDRRTPDGQPVEWMLFMPDEDHFFWVRRDWPWDGRGLYNRTAMRRRCLDVIS